MTSSSRLTLLRQVATTFATIAITLIVVDLVCIALGIFPPVYPYGDPQVGWRNGAPNRLPFDSCVDMSTGTTIDYYRNEVGIRTLLTAAEIRALADDFIIAAVGDSQSDLCSTNADSHQGVLEAELNRAGAKVTVLSAGVGRYSPLQAYLLFKYRLADLGADALVMNLYTGNDFYDILRVDDRPHFARIGDGYEVRPPVWYRLYDPGVERYSRTMFVYRSLMERIGARNFYLRLRHLYAAAREQDGGLTAVFGYMNDLRKSNEPAVGYSGALAAQMLNQQLFFHHFPGSETDSLERTRALMRMIRAENPGLLLVMSPIPSYQLVGEEPVDAALIEILERLPMSYSEGVAQEERLYYALSDLADEEGWIFVDNLGPLRRRTGTERLFNDFDYHLLPPASLVIGENEAAVLGPYIGSEGGEKPPPKP